MDTSPYRSSLGRQLWRVVVVAAAVPAVLVATVPLAVAAPAEAAQVAAPAGSDIIERAVTFTVKNVNGTAVSCKADGATYKERGHITGTAGALADPQTVTLLLHGLSYGEFFSNYTTQPEYNFAEQQAQAGHVTVTIDRLGYDASDKPVGQNICFGSRADIAHQEVDQLRAGSYTTSGATSVAFPRVVLAGHSVGSIIAQAEAYTFGGIDGLMVLSYSDTDVSPAATAALGIATQACHAGGVRQNGSTGPTGYIYFGADTPAKFVEAHFYTPNADPAVVDSVAALRNRDPCGDILSYKAAVATNVDNISKIKVPVLVLTGGNDAIYPVPASKQASLLTGTTDVTTVTIADTGHALTFHKSQNQFQLRVSSWLTDHQFGGWAMPIGAPDTGGGSMAGSMPVGLFTVGAVLILLAAIVWLRSRRRSW